MSQPPTAPQPPPGPADSRRPDPRQPAPLDAQIADVRADPRARWGWLDAALAVVVLFTVPFLGAFLLLRAHLPVAVATLGGECLIVAAVVAGGWRPARRSGGWRHALGLRLPDEHDTRRLLLWSGIQLGVRLVTIPLLVVMVSPLPGRVQGNAVNLAPLSLSSKVVLLITIVFVAPVVEEALFRGVLLRTVMRRTGFWPAAVLTAVLFGAAHAVQGANPASVVVLGVEMTIFGLLQAVLVRRAGNIGPAIGVHSLTNAVSAIVLLLP